MPGPDAVQRAIELIRKRGANATYFFDKLESPDWIKPLWNEGFFRNPPPAERVGESIRFPVWPESRYLARMAPKSPELVRRVALEMPVSDNERAHEDLLEAALNMPPDLGKDIAAKEAKWIAAQSWIYLLVPDKTRRLVRHLADGGAVAAALDLWTALLSPQDEPGEVKWKLRPFEYAEVLRLTTPTLVAADDAATLGILRDLLARAVKERTVDADEGTDYSAIWRPTIEETDDRQIREKIEDALVSATRDCAGQTVQADQTLLSGVVDTLLEGKSTIFTRLALHLVSGFPAVAPELLDRFLCDADLFDNWLVRHEYVLLMRSGFPSASNECQQRILGWIDAGPAPDRTDKHFSGSLDREPTVKEAEEYKRRWQRDRLSSIGAYLDEEWASRYQSLLEEFGDVPDPEFLAFGVARFVGEGSPKSLEELQAMSLTDLAEYLRTWNPSDDPRGPSEGGLASVLGSLVTEDSQRLSASAGLFVGLRPTYVTELLAGLAAHLAKGPIEWVETLSLAQWVTSERKVEAQREESSSNQNRLRWAADAAIELIREGMERPDTGLVIDHRDAVWQIIGEMIDDPEPTPEHEKDSLSSTWDAFSLSLNTTRGKAMHALMAYISWVARNLGDEAVAQSNHWLQSEMPEAFEALERHLDISQDPSLAIRSVYGLQFPFLAHVDAEWSSKNAAVMFPEDADLRAYWDAAWSAYQRNNKFNRNVFRILINEYRHAIALLGTESTAEGTRLDSDNGLAQHMMLLYLNGDLELESGSLLSDFYERASDHVRAHALYFIGRISSRNDFTDEMRAKATLLWGSRLANARAEPDSHREEMRAFGWWVASESFERKWTIDNLESALEIGAGVDVEHRVVESLAELAPKWPAKAIRCLRYLIKADKEGWGIYAWRESARSILSNGLKANEAQELARQVVNELLAGGHLDYRDLLSNRTS